MASQSRKARGMRTQLVLANWFKERGWTNCESTGSGRPGRDLLGTPGVAVEIKARSDLQPLAWLRQAQTAAGLDLPIVIFRPNGLGEANVGQWGVLMTLEHATYLLQEAGYIPKEAV